MDADEFIHVEEVMQDKPLLFLRALSSQERTEHTSTKFLTLKRKSCSLAMKPEDSCLNV